MQRAAALPQGRGQAGQACCPRPSQHCTRNAMPSVRHQRSRLTVRAEKDAEASAKTVELPLFPLSAQLHADCLQHA